MIISMRLHATKEEVAQVRARIEEFGYKVHSIEGEERVVIGAVGMGDVTQCLESLEALPQVEKAVRISAPYKFVSKEFRPHRTEIKVAGATIGGDEFVMMAGPCSVENEKQIMESAEIVARFGGKLLRGGAFKPRTSPYDFQGLELEGLKLLAKAREATGLGIITEVMSDRDVEMVAEYADVLQIGARNMQNFSLLKTLGKCGRPILLKRGMSATVKELLMSAEYIVAHGNFQVMLLRARHSDVRDRDPQHLRHRRDRSAQRDDSPARDSRSQPRGRTAQSRPRPGARRSRRGRRRPDRRNAPQSGKGHERRRSVAGPQAVRQDDVRSETVHRSVEASPHVGNRRRSVR